MNKVSRDAAFKELGISLAQLHFIIHEKLDPQSILTLTLATYPPTQS